MPQGNPDPYSAFSQGLTGGMNTGMNIMQMMQQKAQAKMDESMKKISTSFTVGGQDYLPAQVRVDNINSGLNELDFINKTKTSRVTVDDLTPEKTKALRNMSKIFNDETKTPADKIKLMSMIQAEAGLGTKTEMQSILETEQTKQERERKISGIPATPGLTAPTGYNPNSTDTPNMMYGLTGDVPGTQAIPGLRSLAQEAKMSPLETESMLADYEQTGKFSVPKDKKPTITSDELQGAMAEIGINPSEESSYTTENIGEAAKYLREQKAKASATNIILGADPNSGNIIIGSSKGPISPTAVPTGPLIDKTQTPLTPDQAAKVQLIQQALSYMPAIREGIFGVDPKNPKIDRTDILNIELRTPFTKGRELSTMILDAVEAKLRLESGAAVPDSEVKRMAKRFIPQTADNDNTIKIKINNLEKYLKEIADTVAKGRPLLDRKAEATPAGGNLITVTNPKTGKQETWDTKTQKRVK